MTSTLTEKEIQIVQRIADGENIDRLSRSMNLSYGYAKNVVQRIRAKMQCETTENVVATAIRRGLID